MIVDSVAEAVLADLKRIAEGFARLGRLVALLGLDAATWAEKANAAERVASEVERAARIDSFLRRYYAHPVGRVYWPEHGTPEDLGVLRDRRVDRRALEREVMAATSAVARQLSAGITRHRHPLVRAAVALCEQLQSELRTQPVEATAAVAASKRERASGPVRAVRGPRRTRVDGAFEPTYSLATQPTPAFGTTLRECVPYFWSLSVREAMAADLCLLSIVEYDGLPLGFHQDMAKQAWDEALHAVYFLGEARSLLPELAAALAAGDPLRAVVDDGHPLPVPQERNLFEAIWSMDLVDRLVLMHHDTETPAIPRLLEQMDGPFCRRYPRVAAALEIVRLDEISHSRFGNHWLRELVPDRDERLAAIERARLLRGLYILTAFSHYDGASLEELVDDVIERR